MSAAPRTVALVAHQIHDHGGMERAFLELIRRSGGRTRFVVVSSVLAPDAVPLVEWRRVRVPMRPFPLRFISFFVVAGIALARARRTANAVHTLGAIVPNRVDLATVQFCHAGFVAATGRLTPPGMPWLRRLNTAASRVLALLAERWTYRRGRARLLAPVSEGTNREVQRHYPDVPTVVTPNGVDLERFRRDETARASVRAQLGVADGVVAALFVGGDWDRKGLGEAIEGLALAQAGTSVPLELWVVGGGDRDRFAGLAERRGAHGVRFLGPRTDTERLNAAADLFLLPTLYETFSLVAYEAAASSLPIVATRVSGIDELLDGEAPAGIAVERDPTAIATALVQLAEDPAGRAGLGAAGRDRASAYSWERSVDSVFAAYDRLAEVSE